MQATLYIFTALVRLTVETLRFFGNGGTALPGIFIERYLPAILSTYSSKYSQIIFITGTNGKTTTQLLIRHILMKSGFEVVSNTSGSNMFRGIATTLVASGIPKSREAVLVLEVEEGTMPKIAPYITPNKVIVTNFFRDQLDAYGELHKTVEYVSLAIKSWPNAKLYTNYDDPKVVYLAENLKNENSGFSMGTYAKDFMYENTGGQKLGVDPAVCCNKYEVDNSFMTSGEIEMHGKSGDRCTTSKHPFSSPLTGQYNIYNLMAAILVCFDMGINVDDFNKNLFTFKTPFGRGENVIVKTDRGDLLFRIFLIKNPAGMTQVWNMVQDKLSDKACIVALNDNIADGRDVSWIWDAKLSLQRQTLFPNLYFIGRRAFDMAIRMKYAGFEVKTQNVDANISNALDRIIKTSAKTDLTKEYVVMATYTAMNAIRTKLADYTKMNKFE